MSDQSVIHNAREEQNTPIDFARPWLRHYEQGVPAQLTIPDHPLTWLLDQTVSRYAGNTAFIYYGTKITYAQFSTLANRFATGLQRLGVKPGDRVAIALPNIPQYPIAFYGALRAGAVVVPTNPLYTEREMQHQLMDSGARIVVVLDMFYPVVRAVRENTALEHIIITSPTDYLPPLLKRLYPLSQLRHPHPKPPLTAKELREDKILHVMNALLQSNSKGGIQVYNLPVHTKGDDLAVLQYTGGTTGISKGAMLTHRNLLANALQTRNWIPNNRDGEEVILCVAPFFHSYGLTVGMNFPIYSASTMILLPKFDTKEVVKTISRYHPTQLPGIPTMYIAIMRGIGKHTADLRSIRYCISGAMGLPKKVRMDWEALTGGKLVEGYGLSEAAPVTHCNPLNGDIRDGSIGLPIPSVDAMILDQQTMERAPIGAEGEIMLKGPNIMQGYWNRPDETASIFYEGWMHTGDVGTMDEEGYFYVIDRSKDMIKASGFNIYPREVEEVLLLHPSIAEAAVIGIPHEYRGETVAAVIALKPGVAPSKETRDEIIAYCKKKLTPYKVPKF
ncbi:MAG TPA: long-chain fatty acid--CoA ligase, partial [Ktedonobacteraceae bacterium]|nr:long-chain fatty acid--CoA ligase [Ktedonobacteraceae bacterium]